MLTIEEAVRLGPQGDLHGHDSWSLVENERFAAPPIWSHNSSRRWPLCSREHVRVRDIIGQHLILLDLHLQQLLSAWGWSVGFLIKSG
jgi:hypothetical protein